VIEKLIRVACNSPESFEWSSQLRFYWENDTCTIKQVSGAKLNQKLIFKKEYSALNSLFFGRKKKSSISSYFIYLFIYFKKGLNSPQFCLPYDNDDGGGFRFYTFIFLISSNLAKYTCGLIATWVITSQFSVATLQN
jgi:hypothetical protein